MGKWLIKKGLTLLGVFCKTAASNLALKCLMKGKIVRPYPFSLWSPKKRIVPVYSSNATKTQRAQAINDAATQGMNVQAADYTSWPSLVDRTFTGRHLPPRQVPNLPPIEKVEKCLFRRQNNNRFIASPRLTVLFMSFAQWFTDSFLRTDPFDRRMNTSNHEIDLCQIYGLTESTAEILRVGNDGKLWHRGNGKDEFPEKLFATNGTVKQHFADLPYIPLVHALLSRARQDFGVPIQKRRKNIYATGLERGNSTIGYTSVSTIFLREHNRLCDALKNEHQNWDSGRLFQTARMINTACLLKVVVEDYINALAGDELGKFRLVPGFAEKQRWYRTNRISIEFDLLYRWHGLVPDTINVGNRALKHSKFMYNNHLLQTLGLDTVIEDMSKQPAGAMVLHNTPQFLSRAELGGLSLSRQFQVQPYTFYCDRFGARRPTSFQELTGDRNLAGQLAAIYPGGVDTVDLIVGLRAEKRASGSVLGDLMLKMVGFDAFSQALTNPLLAENVFMRQTFSDIGWKTIENTSTFQDIVKRNSCNVRASFTYK